MTDAELAFKMGRLFNNKITSTFWSSFKGEYGRVQIEVLVYLLEVDSAQVSEIASQLNISKQHVSLIIKEF
ncbi:MAG: MarR family transcriptional regulator [Methanobrevibacter sp.]|uniref:MarR family transcriptional regulator n=1 Tax=Methanobrevibacter sp. TaxID=66852 RepID=UPI001B035AFB|nr:helix-turn-helix domain-containing protein [Methanobrevibacter sp.]MBO6111087.1 MarR family transcriptional regulator [Methanobrevibacter sp.]MBP3791208.1 MarR family transcriptional regulator [Methanobrevibacter sp.]